MRGFHCEAARRLDDDVALVDGWVIDPAGGDERLIVGTRGNRVDLTEHAVFYYRSDVIAELSRSETANPLATAQLGVLLLAPVEVGGRKRDDWTLFVREGGDPVAVLDPLDDESAIQHLRSRAPYSLHCLAGSGLSSHPAGVRLARALARSTTDGIEPKHRHRRWDETGSLLLAMDRSFVFTIRRSSYLVVWGHVGWAGGERPKLAWTLRGRTLPNTDGWSFEVAAPSATGILESSRCERVVQAVGLLPLSADDLGAGVVTLTASAVDSSVSAALPLTKPVPLGQLAQLIEAPVVGTALIELAARHGERPELREALTQEMTRSRRCIDVGSLQATAMPIGAGRTVSAAVDAVYCPTDEDVLAIGWAVGRGEGAFELSCHTEYGQFCATRKVARRIPRRDVYEACREAGMRGVGTASGFCAWFRNASASSLRPDNLYFSIEGDDGTRARCRPSSVKSFSDWGKMLESLLTEVAPTHREDWLDELAPLLSHAWKKRNQEEPVIEDRSYGASPAEPTVSIIVPLYARADLMEHQLASFANDPTLRDAELLYFVDDPRIADEAVILADRCDRLMRVPFRLLSSNQNLGFAGANNRAASFARSDTLLLLNSDVIPRKPNWLPSMLATFRALSPGGVLGAKLLYEDGSIQHAGIRFERMRLRHSHLWLNEHCHKGLPADRLDLTGVAEVPAVTAACLMIDRQTYESVGGLTEDYVFGDFEDSDLCLKIRERGLRSYIDYDVELYHLERQSFSQLGDPAWRDWLVMVNAWLHTQRWEGAITEIAQGAAEGPPEGAGPVAAERKPRVG